MFEKLDKRGIAGVLCGGVRALEFPIRSAADRWPGRARRDAGTAPGDVPRRRRDPRRLTVRISVPARVHPGSPILEMDHSVITLHDGGRADAAETAMLSLYDIGFSAALGAGHVALLRVPAAGVDAVFTDRLELGRAMQVRLLGMGNTMPMLYRDPVLVSGLWRDPWVEGWFGYRFGAPGVDVVARWEGLEPPFFAEGPGGGFSDTEDIWSLFVAALSASIEVNGVRARGAAFEDDVWLPMLGRSMSSAHAAFGETRITPHLGRLLG